MKRILLLIAKNAPKDEKNSKNYPSHIINCALGEINIGLVYLTLRNARIMQKEGGSVWDEDFKKIFETFLSRDIYDAYAVLGDDLISFAFLDKEWTEDKIKEIEKSKDRTKWEAFMSGYLSASRVNLDLYTSMKKSYRKALSFTFDESVLNDRLIDHIGIGYLNGVETINGNGLLSIIWKKWETKQIFALIGYFWHLRMSLQEKAGEAELDKQMRDRILQFWREVYKKCNEKESLTSSDKQILSEVTKLISFTREINEEVFNWLMLSAPYIQEHFNSAFLLESLNLLKENGEKMDVANRIAKIFLEILRVYRPDYDSNDIREIVEYLYNLNNPQITAQAIAICDEYAKHGDEIVSDIFNKYNS